MSRGVNTLHLFCDLEYEEQLKGHIVWEDCVWLKMKNSEGLACVCLSVVSVCVFVCVIAHMTQRYAFSHFLNAASQTLRLGF